MDARCAYSQARIEILIIKGNARGGSKQMGIHLMSSENDHVDTIEVRGFIADDVRGGLQEAYAHSRATKASKFLYSASFSPPEYAAFSDEEFLEVINRAENKLKLNDQPRVIVRHSKDGRDHVHCVWSRIDTEKMKAIPLEYDRDRLNALSRDIFLENGWTLPAGFKDKHNRDLRTFNLAEWQQAKRHNQNPKTIKARIQHAWSISDDKQSFANALAHEGFFLAKGDKKNVHVAVDWHGEVYAITRATGENTKSVKVKLGEPNTSPTVRTTKTNIAKYQSALRSRLQRELSLKHSAENQPLKAQKRALRDTHRAQRRALKGKHDKRQLSEQQTRQAQYQRGLRGLWSLITGRYHKQKQKHEAEYQANLKRDANEKQALREAQLAKYQALQQRLNAIKSRQQKETMTLHADFVTRRMALGAMGKTQDIQVNTGLEISP